MRKLFALGLALAACGGGPANNSDAGADAAVALPAAYQGVFHLEGTLDSTGTNLVTPASDAEDFQLDPAGTYAQSAHGCTVGSTQHGLWQNRGTDIYLPDDKPANPGRIVTADGNGALIIHTDGMTNFTRWQPGANCLVGTCPGATVQSCATPAW